MTVGDGPDRFAQETVERIRIGPDIGAAIAELRHRLADDLGERRFFGQDGLLNE
jgi:hypothetical protein